MKLKSVLVVSRSKKYRKGEQAACKDPTSNEGSLPRKVVFHRRSSSTEGRPPSKVKFPPKIIFQWSSSSPQGRLPPKVVLYHSSPSTKGCLPPKVIFHHRLSSIKGRLPPKVAFHQRSSSTIPCIARYRGKVDCIRSSALPFRGPAKRAKLHTKHVIIYNDTLT